MSNYSMMQHSFVSPMRGSAAVPHNNRREVSSSPYMNKKRTDKGPQRELSEDELNRMVSYNLVNLEEAERKYLDILENEKVQYKKKETASKEIIQELSRRLKQSEKRSLEESKICVELKKRHDQMKKKLEKCQKDKAENVNQLKSLFVLFTQQRKALEVSITKNKKYEEESSTFSQRNKNLEDQHKQFQRRIDQLEQEREMLFQKHKRDRESLDQDLEDKRIALKRYEGEFKEMSSQKVIMKKQVDEYELKVKKMLMEFEEESKKHIRELNAVHEQYRGYKSSSMELEQRIQQYKNDQAKAQQGEREAKKELHRMVLENDELKERLRFVEQRYQQLVHRLGASPEDLQAIEEDIMQQADEEAEIIHQRQSKGKSNKPNQSQRKDQSRDRQHPYTKITDQRSGKSDVRVEEYDRSSDRDRGGKGRRTESRLERRRGDEVVDSYQYYGEKRGSEDSEEPDQIYSNKKGKGVISGEQIIENSDAKRKSSKGKEPSNKKTHIEVLDDERPIEQYYGAKQGFDDDQSHEEDADDDDEGGSESGDLLKKLIENLGGNPALQNQYIKEQFKLDLIKSEGDLHNYKNLLNSMAALFYTNHRMNDVTLLFYMWKEAAIKKQQEREELERQQQLQQQQQHQNQNSKDKKQASYKKGKAVPAIEIDTELANQDVFQNYQQQNLDEDPSEIEQESNLKQNMMLQIDNDEIDPMMDEDMVADIQSKKFLDELKKVGPFSKQILNYSYPPLLYQRGDDEDDEGEGEDDEGGEADGLPDFGHDFDEEEDRDIQELIKGSGLKNEDLYNKLKKVVKDKDAKQYIEQVDEDGNVYLVEASDNDEYGEEYGDEQYMGADQIDDEEFLQMMEQEAEEGRIRGQRQQHQQNSTIINSSQNTSLEENIEIE